MRIRTQFIITMLLFGIILVVMAASAIITNQLLDKASQQERLSTEIAEGASELSYLTDEYLIYRESHQLKRWQSRFASFSENAANLKVDIPQQQALVRNIRRNQTRLKEVFDSVLSALEGTSPGQSAALEPALLQVSWSRMAVQGRELVSDASRLSQLVQQEMDQLTAARNLLFYVMLALFGVFLLSSYMLTYRRIIKSIAKLQNDTKIIGAGNLGFKTEEQKNDEIGDLSRAFNQMTVNLKTVTASKADLEREMADRKQAEEALRESEAKYRNLFTYMAEEVHFWQVVRDDAGRIKTWRLVDANPPTLKTWGRSSVGEIMGKTTDEIFGPGATDHYMPVVQKIMTEGIPYSFDDYFPNIDKYFRFTSVPLGDYFITTGADITNIRKAHEALRESEERWAVTLRSIGDGVIASNTDGRVTFLNKVAEALTGWSLADAVGKPVTEVFRIVNEHTRKVVDDPVSKVLQTGKIVGLANHTVLLCKGGGEMPLDDSGAPIRDKEGRILGVVLVFRDITERKRAEEELQRLSQFPEENPNPVLRVAADAELLYANAPARGWLATLGWIAERPLPAAVREVVADAHGKAQAIEREIRNQDAITFWICAIQPPGENYINLYGIDITGRKRAEKELEQLNESLELQVAERTALARARTRELQALAMELIEAEERERRRVAELLHDDLQQSLASARLRLQGACECQPPDPAALANVEQILGESLKAARRLSHELSPAVLHHSGLVAALEWLIGQIKEQFGLQVQLESDGTQDYGSSPLRVFMFRAAQELLFNVVKHAGVKTARVALSSFDGYVAITVTDQGQGFNPGILDSITSLGGFGLFSLQERARYIGGSLVIDSTPGKGSSFTLKVPINPAKKEKLDHPAMDLQLSNPTESLIPAGVGGIRVLFVDDHHVMRQGLIRLMNGQPVIQVVGEASNGQEAIAKVRQLRPDVVVMDASMPVLDGIEATRQIKAERPEVRVIGLSMYDDEEISQKMRAAGAEAFLSKTASSAELLKAIYGTTHE
jgi:PAS domain S-box-containing protein